MPTVAANAARAIGLAASMHGVSPPELYARVGLDPAVVADNDGRVPAPLLFALWKEVAPLDPDFGLHLAGSDAARPALPWQLLRSSANLKDGLVRLMAAWRLFNDLFPFELVLPNESSNRAVVQVRTKNTPLVAPRHGAEFMFAWFAIAARRATGVDLEPTLVTFEHRAPSRTEEHARLFGCDVVFDADATAIHFSSEALALPTVGGGDRELVELLERYAETLLAKLPRRGVWTSRVRAAMAPLLAGGDVTIDRIAKPLGTSARSMQRHLSEEGTTFQRVLDDLRKEAATQYLEDGTRSIADVALLLGFSDQTAFHRAFVRWTGRTPGEIRHRRR